MNRYDIQRFDAADTLGVNLPTCEKTTEDKENIFLGIITGESLSLAKAVSNYVKKIKKEVDILMVDHQTYGLLKFDGMNFSSYENCNIDFSLFENEGRSLANGNSYLFKKYSEDKYMTACILRMNGIKTPKEIVFKTSRLNKYTWHDDNDVLNDENIENETKSVMSKIENFFSIIGYDRKIVLKPSGGKCGNGVNMFSYDQIHGELELKNMNTEENMLVQEKVDSYPIIIDGVKKDWNLRVLVTYDLDRKEYIVAGIIGRIDNDGAPVNRSISADYISLSEIIKLTGIGVDKYDEIKDIIERASIDSVKCIVDRLSRKKPGIENDFSNYQNLSGVDIIINENLEAVVLEVNDSNSGCMYELMKLEGVDALEPIAKSIIDKMSFFSFNDLF